MTAVYIILAVIVVLCLTRAGVRVEYSDGGLVVWVRVWRGAIQVFPAKQNKKAKTKKSLPKEPRKKGGNFELVKQVLPLAVDALGGLKRKISIDEIQIDLLWSTSDPADCAMGYGAVNGAIGMIWPLIEQNFCVKQRRIRTAVDFEQGIPTVYILAQATMRIGQLLCWAVRLLIKFSKLYRDVKKQQENHVTKQQKEAV